MLTCKYPLTADDLTAMVKRAEEGKECIIPVRNDYATKNITYENILSFGSPEAYEIVILKNEVTGKYEVYSALRY